MHQLFNLAVLKWAKNIGMFTLYSFSKFIIKPDALSLAPNTSNNLLLGLQNDYGHKEAGRQNRKEDINVTSRNMKSKSNTTQPSDVITRRIDQEPLDYEYDEEEYRDKYVIETEKPEPEYYYYYYYDYMDSGIDISHELTTYEPLPSPLPLLASDEEQRETDEDKNSTAS